MSGNNFSHVVGNNWLDWTPTYAGSGSMTFTSVTTNYAKYYRLGNIVFFQIDSVGTTGGTPSSDVYFSLPITAFNTMGTFSVYITDVILILLVTIGGVGFINTTSQAGIKRDDATNWALGTSRMIKCMGFYQV